MGMLFNLTVLEAAWAGDESQWEAQPFLCVREGGHECIKSFEARSPRIEVESCETQPISCVVPGVDENALIQIRTHPGAARGENRC